MDPLTSQPSQERIYRTPAGLHLRMLQIGEVVQKGDFTWLKQGSVEEEDPILAVAGVGRTVTAEMGNNYYRLIQGAAEGEALPEAPAEGSPSLPSAPRRMRVRITKAGQPTYWYADKIGQEFLVEVSAHALESDFKVVGLIDESVAFIGRDDCEFLTFPVPSAPSAPNPIGYALAMRVLQSDLYAKLDDEERGECDAFIKAGAAPSVTMGGAVEALRGAAEHLAWAAEVEIQGGHRTRSFIQQHRSKVAHWIKEVRAALSKLEGPQK